MKTDTRGIVSALIGVGIPALVAAIGTLAILHWLSVRPDIAGVEPRLPSMEAAPGSGAGMGSAGFEAPGGPDTAPGEAVVPAAQPGGFAPAPGSSTAAATSAPTVGGSWPRFRGAKFDNISTESVSLARSWGPQGPARLWSVSLGEGYAAPAIQGGRVYLLDYDMTARADRLRCWDLGTGQELWNQAYSIEVKRYHGMSRTVPAVASGCVVTLGPKCHVMCCDAASGQVKWQIDLVGAYGTTVPEWYAGQCPLIDGKNAILAPGGTALMMAVDLASGNVVWQTPNPKGWKMTHSSIIPVNFGGKRMYVYCASGGVVGVSASDGAILWEQPGWTVSTANVPTPIDCGNGRLFVCGGYNAGSAMLGLKQAGSGITCDIVYRLKANVYGSQQHTPVLYKGYLYGTAPNNQLVCLDLDGNKKWSSGSTKRFGLGPYMIANGVLYILTDGGELALVQPDPSGYKELARAKVLNGPEAWGPLAIAGGLLLARDLTAMVCLDVRG